MPTNRRHLTGALLENSNNPGLNDLRAVPVIPISKPQTKFLNMDSL